MAVKAKQNDDLEIVCGRQNIKVEKKMSLSGDSELFRAPPSALQYIAVTLEEFPASMIPTISTYVLYHILP